MDGALRTQRKHGVEVQVSCRRVDDILIIDAADAAQEAIVAWLVPDKATISDTALERNDDGLIEGCVLRLRNRGTRGGLGTVYGASGVNINAPWQPCRFGSKGLLFFR